MRSSSLRRLTAIPLVAAAIGFQLFGTDVKSATVNTNCSPAKTIVHVATDVVGTGSTIFSTVPASKIAFTSASPGCVIVRFSAEATAGPNANILNVEAVLDGSDLGSPPDTIFATGVSNTNNAPFSVGSMEYLFVAVPAGSHSVVLKFRQIGGGLAQLGKRTMVLQFQ